MIQNAIKILTLGFFISMITGFVMYRSGYFDSEKTSYALHTSPNGGELNSVQVEQDSTKVPEINQNNAAPIMPSSKSIAPAFDLEKYEKEKERENFMRSTKSMTYPIEIKPSQKEIVLPDIILENPFAHSSKSMIHPIKIGPKYTKTRREIMSSSKSIILADPSVSSVSNREAIKVQPELEPKDSSSTVTADPNNPVESSETNIEKSKVKATTETKSTRINWRGIWIGVLGILFVAIGSIVYFKRRSK